MFPNRVPKDTCFVPRAIGLFVYSYPSEEPSPENGQNICSPSSEPHMDRRLTYSGVRPGFPTGLFTHCYHCPVPCSLQHDTFHLDLGRPELRYPACVVVTLMRVSYYTCYCLPCDPGQSRVWIHITLRYRRGVGFMGGDDILTVSLCDGELL